MRVCGGRNLILSGLQLHMRDYSQNHCTMELTSFFDLHLLIFLVSSYSIVKNIYKYILLKNGFL